MLPELPKSIIHCSSLDRLAQIKRSECLRGNTLGRSHPKAWNRKAVFCLEDTAPVEWTGNAEFGDAWAFLRSQIGTLVLEINIDGIQDQVKVLDWAAMERHLRLSGNPFDRYVAERDYLASERSFSDFIADRSKTSLPELLVPAPFSLGRVSVAAKQPFLEELLLGGYLADFRDGLLYEIARVPELAPLYAKHQTPEAKELRALQDSQLLNRQHC